MAVAQKVIVRHNRGPGRLFVVQPRTVETRAARTCIFAYDGVEPNKLRSDK